MKKTWKIVVRHIVLTLLALFWLLPIIWLLVTSLSAYPGINTQHFFPEEWSIVNYKRLFLEPYSFSCMRFKARKPLMNFSIILGMFPGVLSMIAVYFVLKLLGLNDSLVGLIVIYSAGSGLGYLICKGFFDTIPVSLRESAKLEGASELTIFTRIVIPLSKPIIVYTVINSFLNPWMDFVMARLMINSKDPADWTVAIGLYNILQKTLVNDYFSLFCAGGIVVAIPISILFVIMQKFYVEGITGGAVKG